MPDASNRVLVDRSVIRVDGHAFFAFGPRLLLTPSSGMAAALGECAAAGFTAVASPPCSPGTLGLTHTFLDAADTHGLMGLVVADPRLPCHAHYLAEQFAARESLLAYELPPRGADEAGLELSLAESEEMHRRDVFHPCFHRIGPGQLAPTWLRHQDIYCPTTDEEPAPEARVDIQHAGPPVARMAQATVKLAPRPFFCTDLRAATSDRDRRAGVFSDDPAVSAFPAESLNWFPWLTDFSARERRDLLGPEPELLRLQVHDLLAQGARGIFINFLEAMQGTAPYSGRDRFAEAAILAKEIAVFHDFFAEGRQEREAIVESGHPRLRATVLRHGHELLLMLRMEGYEDDYFIDEAWLERTEITMRAPGSTMMSAWRMDFPGARRLEVRRDMKGSMRFQAGPMELTALVLLSPGAQRSEDLANALRDRLGAAARSAFEVAEVRYAKVALIEAELGQLGVGADNQPRLAAALKTLNEARAYLGTEDIADAWSKSRETCRLLRQAVKHQMANALSTPMLERTGPKARLCRSYFTLPRFHRERTRESDRAFMDLT